MNAWIVMKHTGGAHELVTSPIETKKSPRPTDQNTCGTVGTMTSAARKENVSLVLLEIRHSKQSLPPLGIALWIQTCFGSCHLFVVFL
jgi:hypothetical protein